MKTNQKLIRGIDQLQRSHQPSVVSIGNYDGVHLGHQKVIKMLIEKSHELGAPATVVTFAPLAKEFFAANSVVRLMPLQQRVEQLFSLGVDQVLEIEFTAEFAASSPEKFVSDVLINGLGVRYLCVGDDFKFGKDRAGDFEFLLASGVQHGFSVYAHETYSIRERRVSSGWIREAIQGNDFELAERLLGRPYSISGVITQGQQLGRTINYPTANLVLENVQYAIDGVYVVRAILAGGKKIDGVANLGVRPTVAGKQKRLEVHLFDFDEDIYNQKMEVVFLNKIRSEQKFDSIELLRTQIGKDAESARIFFEKPVPKRTVSLL